MVLAVEEALGKQICLELGDALEIDVLDRSAAGEDTAFGVEGAGDAVKASPERRDRMVRDAEAHGRVDRIDAPGAGGGKDCGKRGGHDYAVSASRTSSNAASSFTSQPRLRTPSATSLLNRIPKSRRSIVVARSIPNRSEVWPSP